LTACHIGDITLLLIRWLTLLGIDMAPAKLFTSLLKCFIVGATFFMLAQVPVTSAGGAPKLDLKKGRFLVATENLEMSSFRETIVFLTHYSSQGAIGITINRSANVTMSDVFPTIKEFQDVKEYLYLGGPVRSNGIFMLIKTKRPKNSMKQVMDDIYFSGDFGDIIDDSSKAIEGEAIKVYAGYAGWAPGQLQNEIDRGDWIVIDTDPEIIFNNHYEGLWKKLYKAWSGDWI